MRDTPKIHIEDPTISDHSIMFKETGFLFLLYLWGTFSYFESSKPSAKFLQQCEEVYLLTPTKFNPHCDSYAMNEENMLDWEGNMVQRNHHKKIVLSEIEEDQQWLHLWQFLI